MPADRLCPGRGVLAERGLDGVRTGGAMLFACSWVQEREPWWFRFGSQGSGEIYPSPDGVA